MKTQRTLNLDGVNVAVTAKPNAQYAFQEILPYEFFTVWLYRYWYVIQTVILANGK